MFKKSLISVARGSAIALFAAVFLVFLIGCNQADKMAKEGIFYLEQGKDVTALALFEDALEIDSENSIALYGKGQILIQQEVTRHIGKSMLKKAVLHLSDQKQEKNATLLIAKFSDTKDRIQILRRMIKRKMDDPDVYLQLANAHSKLQKKKEALTIYMEAIRKYPKDAYLKAELAHFYARSMRNYHKAFEYYKQSSEEQEDNIDCLIGLAKTSYLIGKKSQSIQIIQRILGKEITEDKANELREIKKDIARYRWDPTF